MAVVVVVLVLFFSAGAYNAPKSNLAGTHKCCKIPSVYCTCKCSSFEGAPVQAERCAAALGTLRAHLLAGRPLEHHQARWTTPAPAGFFIKPYWVTVLGLVEVPCSARRWDSSSLARNRGISALNPASHHSSHSGLWNCTDRRANART